MSPLVLIAFLAVLIVILSYGIAGLSGAPWVPTRRHDVKRFLDLAEVRAGDRVCDLGCGDGRLVEAAAAAGATAVGYEISLLPLVLAKIRRWRSPHRARLVILSRNFWQADLGQTDVVFTFLVPDTLPRLSLKMTEMKPGTRVVNAYWPIPGQTAVRVSRKPGQADLYLYEIGGKDS